MNRNGSSFKNDYPDISKPVIPLSTQMKVGSPQMLPELMAMLRQVSAAQAYVIGMPEVESTPLARSLILSFLAQNFGSAPQTRMFFMPGLLTHCYRNVRQSLLLFWIMLLFISVKIFKQPYEKPGIFSNIYPHTVLISIRQNTNGLRPKQ